MIGNRMNDFIFWNMFQNFLRSNASASVISSTYFSWVTKIGILFTACLEIIEPMSDSISGNPAPLIKIKKRNKPRIVP